MDRKLAAILSADVQGYSRLMGEDEAGTLRTLQTYRTITDALIAQHRGRIVGTAGDSILAEFPSVVEAVQCAVDIQQELKAKNAELPIERQMQFRIGINLGDVMVEGEQIYGDGVNIAARLESLAEPGGICISGAAYDQVKNKLSFSYEYLGEQRVKNIADPVRVYRLRVAELSRPPADRQKARVKEQPARVARRGGRGVFMLMVVSGVLVAGIIAVRYFPVSTPNTHHVTRTTQEALPLPDKPSIAVLPFTNLSGDPEQEYFSDGITEDIITDLSKFSGLFVIARNSTFTYKGQAVNVKEIGREFGVRYVVEGSTRQAGDRVRVSAQLVEAATSHHLWAENYDRPLSDVFTVQDDIVQQIGAALRVEVREAELARVRRIPTDNLTAYDSVLRGMEYWRRDTPQDNAQARQLLERAIELDPQYANAYTWLGWTYWLEWVTVNNDPPLLERARELAHQALALDDALSGAHRLLGVVYVWQKQPEQAIAEGRQALALDPNNADTYAWLAGILGYAGRPVEAISLTQQAMRLNPRYPAFYPFRLGVAYTLTGQYEEAIAAFQDALRRNPNYAGAYSFLALNYLGQWIGQWNHDPQTLAHALEAAQHAVARSESVFWLHGTLSSVYLWQKRYADALTAAERVVTLEANNPLSHTYLGDVLNHVGRPAETLERMEQGSCATAFAASPAFCFNVLGQAYSLTRRYEEAITAYKQALSHHPGDQELAAHLGLAASYSELGREEEARAEIAEVLKLNPQFSLEVWKQRVPYQDPAVIERIASALRNAGLK